MSKDYKGPHLFIPAGMSIEQIEDTILLNQSHFGIQWIFDEPETLEDRLWENIDNLQGGWNDSQS